MNSKNIKECLSANLKKYRKIKGWSQFEMAEKSDLSEQTINSIEGLRLWPSDKTLGKIANVLDVEIFQLFIPTNLSLKSNIINDLRISITDTVETLLQEILSDLKN